MDLEFHYFITYALARRAMYSQHEAYLLAYSSQYVDDNTYHYYVNLPDGGCYISDVSQTMDVTKPSITRQTIYPVFHFMPGDPDSTTARRKDREKHPLNTTPGNQNALNLLLKAFESGDIYRIGIATHCYADTWAHQNFVGLKDNFNRMRTISGVFTPNIGHADAVHEPDIVHNTWRDDRLEDDLERIDNTARFLDAAEKIFKVFWERPGRVDDQKDTPWDSHWGTLKTELQEAMNESYLILWKEEGRKEVYGKLCSGGIANYESKVWRYAAVEKKELELDLFDRYWARDGFESSDWRKFQDAVKAHRKDALTILSPLYAAAGCPLLPGMTGSPIAHT